MNFQKNKQDDKTLILTIEEDRTYRSDAEVKIIYYESYSKYKIPMTVNNNEDFKKLMQTTSNLDPYITEFAEEYEHCIIEFNATVERAFDMQNKALHLEAMFNTDGPDMYSYNLPSSDYEWLKTKIGQQVTIQAIVVRHDSYNGALEIYPISIK